MVILAYRHQTARAHEKRPSVATEYESGPTIRSTAILSSERSTESSYTRQPVPSAHLRRALALSLTLTHWTPIQYQDSSEEGTDLPGDILTGRIACPRSRVMTSALVASLRPLMPMSAPGSGDDSLASTQHATDRFPRFTHLLRTGTPKPELKEGLVRPQRRSADPGEHPPASLATIPDPLAQRGTGDATCFRPCIASGSGTLGPSLQQSSSPSRASTPTSSAGLLWCPPASEAASAPKLFSDSASLDMASNSAANTSRGSAGTQRLPMPTRRGTDANAGERIIPGTPLSTSPQSQASSDFADAGADADELEQDDVQGGAQTGEGQPKKKKTRRAGVAITRHRKMQREVRRLAEEEDEATIQRQQPQRSLLHNVQRRPSLSPSPSGGPSMSFHSPSQYAPNPQVRSVTSPIPSTLSTTRPMPDVRHTRSEPFPAPQPGSRAPAGYDHTLEDGDDVVVWRPSTGMGGSSNIWAMRPDERPRGGSS